MSAHAVGTLGKLGNAREPHYYPGGNQAQTAAVNSLFPAPRRAPSLLRALPGWWQVWGALIMTPTVSVLPGALVTWPEAGGPEPCGGRGQTVQLCPPPSPPPR